MGAHAASGSIFICKQIGKPICSVWVGLPSRPKRVVNLTSQRNPPH